MKNLKHAVREKLKLHTEYYTGKLTVLEHDGIVELSGYVDGEDAKASLEGIARMVPGVRDVINHMKIDSHSMSGVQGLGLR